MNIVGDSVHMTIVYLFGSAYHRAANIIRIIICDYAMTVIEMGIAYVIYDFKCIKTRTTSCKDFAHKIG